MRIPRYTSLSNDNNIQSIMTPYIRAIRNFIPLICLGVVIGATSLAQAQDSAKGPTIDILPAKSVNMEEIGVDLDDKTHPPLKITPDKSELIRLERDAFTVIVGNPMHLNVLADSSDTLILVGRAPGATHFLALDAKGEVLMSRHIIVASPKEKYIRIRNSCANASDNCQETQMYYCPDMCHQILIDSASEADAPSALPTAGPDGGAGLPGDIVPDEETP